MSPKQRRKTDVEALVGKLKTAYPEARCSLEHRDPFQLIVATILSAQCTDERVNMVTPGLFRKFPDAAALSAADQGEVEKEIRSTGFFKNKAKSLLGCSRRLVEKHAGKVPDRMEDLIDLPGVGRKTANVVLGNAFGIASGIVVDTHVKRLSWRMGLSDETDPEKIEADLVGIIPKDDWIVFSHLLILHGRKRCSARKPDCGGCEVSSLCQRRLERE